MEIGWPFGNRPPADTLWTLTKTGRAMTCEVNAHPIGFEGSTWIAISATAAGTPGARTPKPKPTTSAGTCWRPIGRDGVLSAVAGIGTGVAGALALTRSMSSLLFGVSAADPLIYAAVSVLLAAVALVAVAVPASRAMRIDPLTALRDY